MTNQTTRQMIRIHNVESGEIIDREMNDDEFAAWEANKIALDAIETAAAEAKAKAELEKAALLDRLGLTEDELKIILG